MRYLTPLLVLVLIVSILLNTILIMKYRFPRPVFTVNGQAITRPTMDGYLEQQHGPEYKAMMTKRILVDQEAHAQGVAPTDAEIDDEFNLRKELDYRFADQVSRAPWAINDVKEQIREQQELENLLVKDLPVTDEEIKTEYLNHPNVYDTPNKARCLVGLIFNDAHTEDIRRKMAQTSPPVSPIQIMQDYPGDVIFIGDNNVYTATQPLGTDVNKEIFALTPKDVIVQEAGSWEQIGARKIIVRLDSIIPGHRADLNDPKLLQRIKHNASMQHAKPVAELLSTLWSKAKLEFEDPADKARVERLFFPDKARAESTPAKQ